MAEAVIETYELTKVYGKEKAVDSLTFSVNEGEIFGLLGPNGAGKTTVILMLLGLTEPTSGKARVLGVDPTRDAIKVKGMIGYMPENVGFYNDMNAVQSLRFIGELNGIPKKVLDERIEKALSVVELDKEAKKKIAAYSRGMRQRLAIAELLIKEPKVAFLDEPTLGLDPDAQAKMIELIAKLREERGMTIILCSHYLEMVEKLCDRVGIMIKGKMVALGDVESLARQKFGIGQEEYTLHEIYMKYFLEA